MQTLYLLVHTNITRCRHRSWIQNYFFLDLTVIIENVLDGPSNILNASFKMFSPHPNISAVITFRFLRILILVFFSFSFCMLFFWLVSSSESCTPLNHRYNRFERKMIRPGTVCCVLFICQCNSHAVGCYSRFLLLCVVKKRNANSIQRLPGAVFFCILFFLKRRD